MQAHTSRACLLISGGLDSAVLVSQFLTQGTRVVPLYLRCGFFWERVELYWLRRFLGTMRRPKLSPLEILELSLRGSYGPHWSLTGRRVPSAKSSDDAVYLPGRNVLLLSHAAIVCARRGISTIALGILKGNPFGDASPQFLTHFGAILAQALRHRIRIVAPLRASTKTQLVRRAQQLPLGLTFSCLNPQGLWHCGRCNKCAERKRAFREADVEDPTRYAK